VIGVSLCHSIGQNRLFIVFLCLLPLAGCYSEQKQQLAKCRIQEDAYSRPGQTADANVTMMASSNRVELCMEAAGYEMATTNDTICHVGISSDQDYMVTSDYTRAAMPICYQPTGWFAKLVFRFENALGNVR
jgi:hypothetical protein